jgi:threonine dehydrogenase-like Zn-dependent dehydrogenase
MMRAVVRRGARLILDCDVPAVAPGAGQALVRTLACGICGSDLHALHHLDHMADIARRSGATTVLDPDRDVIFGHEFCAEIVEYGPHTEQRLAVGTRVVSIPMAAGAAGMEVVGYSNHFPGGFAETMVLQEMLLLPVPNGLTSSLAATTEPFAVGAHAVARAAPYEDSVCMIIGCGPVGLAVLAGLKARGIGPVVACDFSAARRAAAVRLGADHIIDPAAQSPHALWAKLNVAATLAEHAMALMMGQGGKRPVIFECVGAPGVLQSIIEGAPPGARIVVAGVCMQRDSIEPALAINKQLGIDFVLGYSPEEFAGTLADIAEGRIDAAAVVSEEIGLAEVPLAFERLSREPELVKITVDSAR